ncbi:hypothetical protein B0J13DRAFT_531329 [Dactylonectria estremocensis]|uniref:Uncharacterized protein n=1 Tax=Dactylonectria estremocensis TaxID=1079267 RepID=A0A9P9IK11_9HYPO|nr:hypothetical protein B0J13DRAFT_531329 [Dactylonectria estremocensis]
MRPVIVLSLALGLFKADYAVASQCKPRSVSSSAIIPSLSETPTSSITAIESIASTPSETPTSAITPIESITSTPSDTITPETPSTPTTPTSSSLKAIPTFSLFPDTGDAEGETVKGAQLGEGVESLFVEGERAGISTVLFTIEESTGRVITTGGYYLCVRWYSSTLDPLPADIQICPQGWIEVMGFIRFQYVTSGHCNTVFVGPSPSINCYFDEGLTFNQFYIWEAFGDQSLSIGLANGGYDGYDSFESKCGFKLLIPRLCLHTLTCRFLFISFESIRVVSSPVVSNPQATISVYQWLLNNGERAQNASRGAVDIQSDNEAAFCDIYQSPVLVVESQLNRKPLYEEHFEPDNMPPF